MEVHFTTGFLEYCASPFNTCDLRDALKETCWRMADICVGLFVANAEPEPCLHRGMLLSQLSKCIWLQPKRSRLTERSGKPCRIQQRYVRGGETAETQSTDQVPLCRKARDSCPCSAHDILGDEPSELRVTDVVRMPSRGLPVRHEDQGHRRNASALHQRRENRKRMNVVSVVLTVKEYAQRVVRPWPLDEPCGTHVLALRALDAHFLSEHGSILRGCSLGSDISSMSCSRPCDVDRPRAGLVRVMSGSCTSASVTDTNQVTIKSRSYTTPRDSASLDQAPGRRETHRQPRRIVPDQFAVKRHLWSGGGFRGNVSGRNGTYRSFPRDACAGGG